MTDIARRFAELRSAVANGTYSGPLTPLKRKTMDLPDFEDLDAMTRLIGGENAEFENLPIPDRMRIIELCNQANAVTAIVHIRDSLEKIEGYTDRIDDNIAKVGDWFKYSKTYEGR